MKLFWEPTKNQTELIKSTGVNKISSSPTIVTTTVNNRPLKDMDSYWT